MASQDNALSNIKNVIVLMFENRSFDHLLGAMPGVDGVIASVDGVIGGNNVKADLYNTMKPLKKAGPDNPAVPPTGIIPGVNPHSKQNPQTNYESDYIVHGFNHAFGTGMIQDLFGPGTTGIIQGQPQNAPTPTYPATNSGFLSAPSDDGPDPNGPGALTYFEWNSMQVFHKLASTFVVCDAWYCDMPGHTAPNRAFMHCATTGDIGICDDDNVGPYNMVNRPTIFERIQQEGQTWKMYWLDSNCDTNWLNEQVYSQRYDPSNPTAFNVTQVPIANFFADLANGTLPFYSFIMCFNGIGWDTSMHPTAMVEPGENFLACIYNALRQSPYWENTLLIVNFDENGGMYDHQTTPVTVAPYSDPSNPPPVYYWPPDTKTYAFDFTTLGPRIPAILISPWLKAGIYSTQLQNTSVLRFLQDLLPNQTGQPYSLTYRDLNAPSIAPIFDYTQFGSTALRTDCPSNIQGYVSSPVHPQTVCCAQFLWGAPPSEDQLAAVPPPYLVKITKQYLSPLPGHPDSGKPITRTFATVGEMRAYAREREDAAFAHIKAKKARQ
jgi:phospholipase C